MSNGVKDSETYVILKNYGQRVPVTNLYHLMHDEGDSWDADTQRLWGGNLYCQ